MWIASSFSRWKLDHCNTAMRYSINSGFVGLASAAVALACAATSGWAQDLVSGQKMVLIPKSGLPNANAGFYRLIKQ